MEWRPEQTFPLPLRGRGLGRGGFAARELSKERWCGLAKATLLQCSLCDATLTPALSPGGGEGVVPRAENNSSAFVGDFPFPGRGMPDAVHEEDRQSDCGPQHQPDPCRIRK